MFCALLACALALTGLTGCGSIFDRRYSSVTTHQEQSASEEDASILPVAAWILVGYFFTYLLNCWIDKSMHHEDDHHSHTCACGHHDLHTAAHLLVLRGVQHRDGRHEIASQAKQQQYDT